MPPKPERQSGSSRLTNADRNMLVEIIAQNINNRHEEYFRAPNWSDARRYMPLVGMMGSLALESLGPQHQAHIKKMIAHKTISLPKGGRKPLDANEFMEQVQTTAKSEIEYLQSLNDSDKPLARPYALALEDLDRVSQKLVTEPLLLTLRQSLRATREKKSRKNKN